MQMQALKMVNGLQAVFRFLRYKLFLPVSIAGESLKQPK